MNLDQLQNFLGLDNKSAPAAPPDPSKPGAERAGRTGEATGVMARLQEIQLAQKLGYLICKCTWPPTVMTLSTSDFVYRCPHCSRVRDF